MSVGLKERQDERNEDKILLQPTKDSVNVKSYPILLQSKCINTDIFLNLVVVKQLFCFCNCYFFPNAVSVSIDQPCAASSRE